MPVYVVLISGFYVLFDVAKNMSLSDQWQIQDLPYGGGANLEFEQNHIFAGFLQKKQHKNERNWSVASPLVPPFTSANADHLYILREISLADLRGVPGTRSPPRSKFFQFHAIFGEKVAK